MGAVPQIPSVPTNFFHECSNPGSNSSKKPSWLKLSVRKDQVHLINLVNENRIVIIAGHRGCGKSTQIPQVCSFPLALPIYVSRGFILVENSCLSHLVTLGVSFFIFLFLLNGSLTPICK